MDVSVARSSLESCAGSRARGRCRCPRWRGSWGCASPVLHLSGNLKLTLPRTSWPIADLAAEAYLPAVFNYRRQGGSLEQVPDDEKSWDATFGTLATRGVEGLGRERWAEPWRGVDLMQEGPFTRPVRRPSTAALQKKSGFSPAAHPASDPSTRRASFNTSRGPRSSGGLAERSSFERSSLSGL